VTNLILGTVTFGILAASPSLLLTLASLFSTTPPRPNRWDDFLLMAYLLGMTKGLATLGFLLSTAFSEPWRRLRTWRALLIAGALGLAEPIASFAVLAAGSSVLLPLFRSALWGALALAHGLPGLLLGMPAHLLARRSVGHQPAP
jgi:hypothetical protein